MYVAVVDRLCTDCGNPIRRVLVNGARAHTARPPFARATCVHVRVPINVHHGCVHTLHAILLVRLMARAGRIIFCNNANERSLCAKVDTRAARDRGFRAALSNGGIEQRRKSSIIRGPALRIVNSTIDRALKIPLVTVRLIFCNSPETLLDTGMKLLPDAADRSRESHTIRERRCPRFSVTASSSINERHPSFPPDLHSMETFRPPFRVHRARYPLRFEQGSPKER